MIISSSDSPLQAYKTVFFELYNNALYDSVNPKHWREAVACIEIKSIDLFKIDHAIFENRSIRYNFDVLKVIPELDSKVIEDEIVYYSNKLFNSDIEEVIINALKIDKFSKRLYYNFWEKEFVAPNVPCVCVSGCYFKVVNNSCLEMHVHSRANNAYSLLLIDMQFMIGFQKYIALQANLTVGKYYHFFDSIHFFNSDKATIKRQYQYLQDNLALSTLLK